MMKLGIAVAVLSIPLTAADREKPRVYLTESQTLRVAGEIAGDALVGDSKGSLSVTGGTSPRITDAMKNFARHCPGVVITLNPERADYVARFDYEEVSPATLFVGGNKVAVFDQKQELIYSVSTRRLTNAVKHTCTAILSRKRP
jgi:hypothetical protein